LYDEGYTSIGNVEDTFPCPALKKVNATTTATTTSTSTTGGDGKDETNDKVEYWPAYMLKDWDLERAGRIKKKKKDSTIYYGNATATATFNTTANKNNAAASTEESKGSTAKGGGVDTCTTTINSKKLTDSSVHPLPEYVTTIEPSTSTTEPNATSATDMQNSKRNLIMNDEESSTYSKNTLSQRTVGLLIIGDEILKGLTPDANTLAAAAALREKNVPLARVAIVSDNPEEIVSAIRQLEKVVDVIITSGGVGPTHDDVTIKSVATFLESDMVLNEDMALLLQEKMRQRNASSSSNNDDGEDTEISQSVEKTTTLSEAQIKMATLPQCSRLRNFSDDENAWPILQCKNIFILPGVPQFFEPKVQLIASYLSTELARSVAFKVVLSIDENNIVPVLNSVVQNHPNVSFGSYPFVNHPNFKTVVTLESKSNYNISPGKNDDNSSTSEDSSTSGLDYQTDPDIHVKLALSDLVNRMPEGSVLRVENNNDLSFV